MRYCLKLFFVLSVFLICFSSCAEKQDYTVMNKDFLNEEWNRFDYLTSDFDVKKTPLTCDLVMDIKVSDVYPNIYPYHEDDNGVFTINMTITNPDEDGYRSKEYKFYLKDKEGNWKSDKTDGYYTFQLPLINGMTFSETGFYKFIIENKYSKDPLYGMKNLAIRCIPIK